MYQLTLTNTEIVASNQGISLVGYEELNRQLDKLGEYLNSIIVTPENIKENKKLVAQVRKACKTLDQERLEFKREYLKPLKTLEAQIKAIDQKAAQFESLVRVQIRELEEQEREEKEQKIKEIFTKRLRAYGTEELYPFESFIKPKHLNKSVTISKVEEEMAEWLENRQNDINALITYSESIPQDKDTVITQYLLLENVSETMLFFNELNEKKEQVKKAVQNAPKRANKPQTPTTVLFRIKESDVERVKQLLTISNIEFEIA